MTGNVGGNVAGEAYQLSLQNFKIGKNRIKRKIKKQKIKRSKIILKMVNQRNQKKKRLKLKWIQRRRKRTEQRKLCSKREKKLANLY